jgi:hypothetical protein
MPRNWTVFIVLALIFAGNIVFSTPSWAEFFGCNDQRPGRVLSYSSSAPVTHEFAAQTSRPRINIYPRRNYVGRNSVRQCRASLVKEYRISGTVIVPHMHCWWE